MRRHLVLLVPALLAAACGGVPYAAGGATGEQRAAADARKAADLAGDKLYTARVRPARDMAHRAADLDDVDVMRVTGTSTAGDGIRLVLRTSGTAAEDGPFPTETVTVKRCFEMSFSTTTEWHEYETRQVKCPPGEPLKFKPWPKTPDIPSEKLE